jgi:hypothetical protein
MLRAQNAWDAAMARQYAGILALIAFLTVLARAAITGQSPLAAVKLACACLFAFALIGAVAGWVGGRLVEEAVEARFNAEVAQQRPPDRPTG